MEENAAHVLYLVKEGNVWRGVTGREIARDVRRLALALADLGVKKGDRVGIVSTTRAEWAAADLAILHLGGVTVGVYPTLLAKDVAYQLVHSGTRVVFVEDGAQLDKLRSEKLGLDRVIVIDPRGTKLEGKETSLEELSARGERLDQDPGPLARFDAAWRAVGPDDLATIIYTSGTTGPPKGAVLSHGKICYTVSATLSVFPHEKDEVGVVFLPLAHALQRVSLYCGIARGARGAWNRQLDRLLDDIREVRPTIQVSVPRIWEKAYVRIREGVARASPRRKRIFEWALAVGRSTAPYRKAGKPLPLGLRLKHELAKRLVYDRVKTALFGGRVRFLTSGGAPIGVDILEFFYALDLLIIEGYGLTETAAPASFNRIDDFRYGTVGHPIPGTELRIAEDGEVLVKGPGVFQGYWKDEDATRAAFTDDGWFKTGDIGEIDQDGFLRITDRKKDLIVTSGGKKIPPQNVENLLKARCPLIAAALVHGDRRNFPSALISLDVEEVTARLGGLPPGGLAELTKDPRIVDEVAKGVEAANAELASYERVRKWAIVPDAWTVESGALTPTLKLKRRVLEKRYEGLLDGFYAAPQPTSAGPGAA
jgi:long-chain acyl-CoA synthetase